MTVLALRAAARAKERGCPCGSHALERGAEEPGADCMGEAWGVRLGVGRLGWDVLLLLFWGQAEPGALPSLL